MTKIDWSKARKSGPTEQVNPGGRPRRSVVDVDNWDDLERVISGEAPRRRAGAGLRITAQEIESAKTPKGAWTKATLAGWGVPWPPPAGWKAALIAGVAISEGAHLNEPAPRESVPDSLEAKLLHQVVMAMTSAGLAHLLADLPDVLAYFGGSLPTVAEIVGGRPENALITGGISFDDKVWSFSCGRAV